MKTDIRKITGSVFIILICAVFCLTSKAQSAKGSNTVFVDERGVMRWGSNRAEVQGFGINYTVPFAHAYRAAKQLNVSHKEAIDQDVYHFARLGFDFYRVHVWDTEISDTVGNLLNNDHLQLFDYMLKKMKDRGMKFILTPIAYWGNGYPERDEKTPGFSAKYGKGNCLTDEGAIKAQEQYLFQFLNHVNPLTGVAYKDDPDIIAFEISNEPHHGEAPEKVTTFINRLVKSMRNTGCKKPIFYNISHSIHLVDAYFDADIQGGTFQWYPTGLGARHELRGNFLPNVDEYLIPFAENPKFRKSAKIVYEFDAADVGRSYIYPAMARSFREAGMQVAAHFAYDPTYMAFANTEYNTHFMNLAYAPQKALSLMLASEVFHRVPMYKNYGKYPANTSFDGFRVSYEEDLAELVTDTRFIYTNNTPTSPATEKLEQVSGFGNSSVVKYQGKGAYFLDRLEKGVWRLEVMPDAIWVGNPFGRNSLKKEVAVVDWKKWPMEINLPDLGEDYSVTALNDNNLWNGSVSGKTFTVQPGSYLLLKKGSTTKLTRESRWKNITLKEFSSPPATAKTFVDHVPLTEVSASSSFDVTATIVSPEDPVSAEVYVYGTASRPEVFKMKSADGYQYTATLPETAVREGFLRYHIVISDGKQVRTYPANAEGRPTEWDFYHDETYMTRVVPGSSSITLFHAVEDTDQLSRQWLRTSTLVPMDKPGDALLQINVEKLFTPDPENRNAKQVSDYSIRYHFGKKISGRKSELLKKQDLIFTGKSMNNKPCTIQLALVAKDGTAYGATITVQPDLGEYRIPISSLRKVKLVTLPRPYPTFLPYYFENDAAGPVNVTEVETLQFSIGPGIPAEQLQQAHGVAIQSVSLN